MQRLIDLRLSGWELISHHDLVHQGNRRVSYFFAHESGIWVRGEAMSDEQALEDAYLRAQAKTIKVETSEQPQLTLGVEHLEQFIQRLARIEPKRPYTMLDTRDFEFMRHLLPVILAADRLTDALAIHDAALIQRERVRAALPEHEPQVRDDSIDSLFTLFREAQAAADDAALAVETARYQYQNSRHQALAGLARELGVQ